MNRIRRIKSHAGLARFLANELTPSKSNGDLDWPIVVGYIPRQRDIPSPYAYSPTHVVNDWTGRPIIIVETAHKQYDVFLVPPYTKIWVKEDAAENVYLNA